MLQSNQLQHAFTNLRKLRPANISFSSPITAIDGTLVSDKQGKLRCWKEFYEGMLNRQPINPPEALREAASEATPTPSFPVYLRLLMKSTNPYPVVHQGSVVSLLNCLRLVALVAPSGWQISPARLGTPVRPTMIGTRSSADADKPARRVYRSVKVIKHSTIPYIRYSFLLCKSNFVFKTFCFYHI